MPRLRPLVLAAAMIGPALLVVPAASAATLPTGPQTEIEANRPIPVPSTTSCTVTVMQHTFANSYGAPYTGTYTPPAGCPAPWNTIVATFTSTVGGVQFDRTVTVDIGGAEVLLGTTSEPCCTGDNTVTWSVQRDVTDYAALFTQSEPVTVELDNVTDSTYTGEYDSTLTLAFYETGPGAPAPTVASHVYGVTPLAGYSGTKPPGDNYTIDAAGQLAGGDVTFPRDLSALQADLFAEGQGPCEEFWWSEPADCGVGTPFREVDVYIDGTLAGAAPVYPTTFTGADGPGLWEPIPSPRAWDLLPYRVDLTPFVADLTDGQPHLIQLGVTDAAYTSGDFWALAATLLASTQSYAPVTTGALTAVGVPGIDEDLTTDPSGTDSADTDTVSTSRTWSGYITGADGTPVTTTVTEDSTLGASVQPTSQQPAADPTLPEDETTATTDSGWTWDRQSATTYDGVTDDVTSHADFSIVNSALTHFSFTDDDATTTRVAGAVTGTQRHTEDMATTDTSGEAFYGTESEDYGYADTTGACYQESIASAAGEYTTTGDGDCPDTTAVPLLAAGQSQPPGGPSPALGETSLPVLVGGAGVLLAGGAVVRSRRRRARR